MKPIVEKMLKSGLVSKHTAMLMEKWGTLDRGASELVGQDDLRKASEETLLQFAEELDTLVEEERRSIHETRLTIEVGKPFLIRPLPNSALITAGTVVFMDEMGNFIFPKFGEWVEIGNQFQQVANGQCWEIGEVTPLFVGENQYAHQVKATKIKG